jgi:hypothetical protein
VTAKVVKRGGQKGQGGQGQGQWWGSCRSDGKELKSELAEGEEGGGAITGRGATAGTGAAAGVTAKVVKRGGQKEQGGQGQGQGGGSCRSDGKGAEK